MGSGVGSGSSGWGVRPSSGICLCTGVVVGVTVAVGTGLSVGGGVLVAGSKVGAGVAALAQPAAMIEAIMRAIRERKLLLGNRAVSRYLCLHIVKLTPPRFAFGLVPKLLLDQLKSQNIGYESDV